MECDLSDFVVGANNVCPRIQQSLDFCFSAIYPRVHDLLYQVFINILHFYISRSKSVDPAFSQFMHKSWKEIFPYSHFCSIHVIIHQRHLNLGGGLGRSQLSSGRSPGIQIYNTAPLHSCFNRSLVFLCEILSERKHLHLHYTWMLWPWPHESPRTSEQCPHVRHVKRRYVNFRNEIV